MIALALAALAIGPGPPAYRLESRSVEQDRSAWRADYAFRRADDGRETLDPARVVITVGGTVSNSRVPGHDRPREAAHTIDLGRGPSSTIDVIRSANEDDRCREKATVEVRSDDPGDLVRVRVVLEHDHPIYGTYHPLLGRRPVAIQLGGFAFHDALETTRERYAVGPDDTWPEPDGDRKDIGQFFSPPDSLILEAGVPGSQYFRFPERKVRPGDRMRLRFRYLIARGTEGEFRARVAQYRESPSGWKVLTNGGSEYTLATVGRWAAFDRVIRMEPDATTFALDLRIANAEVGEVWIDDASLESLDTNNPEGRP